jgi:hypothetical protein
MVREGQAFWRGGRCPKEGKKGTYTRTAKAMERGEKVGLKELLRRHSSLSSLS